MGVPPLFIPLSVDRHLSHFHPWAKDIEEPDFFEHLFSLLRGVNLIGSAGQMVILRCICRINLEFCFYLVVAVQR